jgi:hypothetical protein
VRIKRKRKKNGRPEKGGGKKMEKKIEEGGAVGMDIQTPGGLVRVWIDKDNIINCKDVDGKIELPQEGYKNKDFKSAENAIIAMWGGQPVWGLQRYAKNKWTINA